MSAQCAGGQSWLLQPQPVLCRREPAERTPAESEEALMRRKRATYFRQGGRAMKCSKQSFAIVPVFFALFLLSSAETLNAHDADFVSQTFSAVQTAKQKCMNTCRARYRDYRRLKQLPSFECRNVYQDCTRYTCTGLGPG